jgi:tRNA(Ile)-lysidine synthase
MTDLLGSVRAYANRHGLLPGGAAVVVGVSGGADSLCLLHLLVRLAGERKLRLHVAHLDHGLRGSESAADAEFVHDAAVAWDLPVSVERLAPGALDTPGLSLEEAARNARYAFLIRVARRSGAAIVAAGHNADDQAETVLMHFLRGSGVAGLRGMLPKTGLGDYRLAGAAAEQGFGAETGPLLVRPLLGVTRAEIDAYCLAHGLLPRYDATNADATYYRNRLRHELLPLLESYNPGIRGVLQRTAEVMAGDYEVLREGVEQAWNAVVLPAPRGEVHFNLIAWRALPLGQQRAIIREAVARLRHHLRNINWTHVERAVWLAREGQTGQSATLAAGLALHLRYERMVVGPEVLPQQVGGPRVGEAIQLVSPGVTRLAGGWRVEVELISAGLLPADYNRNTDPWCAFLDADVLGGTLILRPRVPGDVFQPHGLRGHAARVNEFMINARIAREERASWPLLIAGWGVAWLCGLRLDERAIVQEKTRRVWRVRFIKE